MNPKYGATSSSAPIFGLGKARALPHAPMQARTLLRNKMHSFKQINTLRNQVKFKSTNKNFNITKHQNLFNYLLKQYAFILSNMQKIWSYATIIL